MAKASEIISRLVDIAPKLTNLFSDSLAITSLTRSGAVVTAVTASAHGLVTGKYVNIVGAQAPVQVASITRVGDIATAITSQPHDLTEGWQSTIKITGADQVEYNGDALPLLTVPNRTKFTYQVSGTPATPATGTNILLFDGADRGYNGRKQITVVDSTTFTYPITTTPLSPAIGSPVVKFNIRISGAATINRAIEAYTAQQSQKLWAYVVLGDTSVSKDRRIYNDANSSFTKGVEFRQREIQKISVYVITPSTDEIAGRAARDLMEDLRLVFYKAILRFRPASGLTDQTDFLIAFNGHGLVNYEGAYYIHQFEFETISDITAPDTAETETVAFRDIDFTLANSPDELITTGVNLDDEPA
jgi:hypothetical protein